MSDSGRSADREYQGIPLEETNPPPRYQDIQGGVRSEDYQISSEHPQPPRREVLRMVDVESCLNPRSNLTCKLVSSLLVVSLAIVIACLVDSYHKIDEGNVGIYFRHGALQGRVTEPGVHFMMPFIEDFREVRVRPETYTMEEVKAITKDGIENTFREIQAITTVKKDKIITMTKQFGIEFKNVLIYDRIKENLRIFCANHTINEVYNTLFLTIVQQVLNNVRTSISRLGEDGIEILNLVVPKPEIPADIAHNYKQVKVQWTEQLVANQTQKTEEIRKKTELIKAVADAERQKAVLEIKIQEQILEKEGQKNVSTINNDIRREAEQNEADIAKYKIEKEAEANSKLFTDKFVQLNLAKSLSNNTKFYFSGDNSALGSIFQKVLGNN